MPTIDLLKKVVIVPSGLFVTGWISIGMLILLLLYYCFRYLLSK